MTLMLAGTFTSGSLKRVAVTMTGSSVVGKGRRCQHRQWKLPHERLETWIHLSPFPGRRPRMPE
jgi:hypothetical protein